VGNCATGEGGARSEANTGRAAIYVKGPLRAGQAIEHTGDVIVDGDVNKDALVVSGGDVMVWGRLRGEVHAGRLPEGEPPSSTRTHSVLALQMQPTVISIGAVTAFGPTGVSGASVPERATVGVDPVTGQPCIRCASNPLTLTSGSALGYPGLEEWSRQRTDSWGGILVATFRVRGRGRGCVSLLTRTVVWTQDPKHQRQRAAAHEPASQRCGDPCRVRDRSIHNCGKLKPLHYGRGKVDWASRVQRGTLTQGHCAGGRGG
jgi:hypothetical protein